MVRNERGWVLIDALIGLVIVSIALTALATAYYQSTSASAASNNRVRALYIAQQELENLKRFDRRNPSTNTIVLPAPRQVPPENPQFTVQVQQINVSQPITALAPRLVPVQVTVSWQEASGAAADVRVVGYYYQLE